VVKLVHQDRQEMPEDLETQELLARQDNPEGPRFKPASSQLHHRVTHAQLDHPDRLDRKARLVMLDQMDNQEIQDHNHSQDHPDLKDLPDLQDSPVIQAPQDNPANLPKAKIVDLVHQDLLEIKDHQDLPDLADSPDSLAAQVPQDPRDHLDNLDNRDNQAVMDSQENPEVLALPVRRVSVPSIAPSTEESSSRTERADVKPWPSVRIRAKQEAISPLKFCPDENIKLFSLLLVVHHFLPKTAIYYVSTTAMFVPFFVGHGSLVAFVVLLLSSKTMDGVRFFKLFCHE